MNPSKIYRPFRPHIAVALILVGLIACQSAPLTPLTPLTPPAAPAPKKKPSARVDLVIRNANIVDLEPTPRIRLAQSVHLRGERVSWIGSANEEPPTENAVVIDGAGLYLIAGLAEMHAHFPTVDDPVAIDAYFESLLTSGVTTVRSMRGHVSHKSLRDSIRAGHRIGPDLVLASTAVAAKTLDRMQADQLASDAKQRGADFIKLLGVGDLESYQHLVAAATQQGLAIAGHLPPFVSIEQASDAKQQTIEHLGGVLPALKRSVEEAKAVAIAAAQSSPFHCPTLFWYAVQRGVYRPADLAEFDVRRFIPDDVEKQWNVALEKKRDSESIESVDLSRMADRFEALRMLDRAGANLVVGADASGIYAIPGPAYHRELGLFAAAGLEPASILRAATVNAAKLRGVESTEGSVDVGKKANLVLVGANPLSDIKNLRQIRAVILRGRQIDFPSK